MEKINRRFTVLALVVAGSFASVLGGGIFDLWDTAIGVSLLAILRLYPKERGMGTTEMKAYACALALIGVMIVGFTVDATFYYMSLDAPAARARFMEPGSPLYVGTLLLFVMWSSFTIVGYLWIRKKYAEQVAAPDRVQPSTSGPSARDC